MATGYEHMTDQEFWAEVAELLKLTDVGGLADYVHEEGERRDAELAKITRERITMIKAAQGRVPDPDPFSPSFFDTNFTPEEDVKFDGLVAAYNDRFRHLARVPGTKENGD